MPETDRSTAPSPILVVGSVALDAVRTPTEMVAGVLGGAASYFSLAAALLAPVHLVGAVGDDFPAAYRTLFERRRVDLSGLQVKAGRTFRWSGEYQGPHLGSRLTRETQLNVFSDFHPQLLPAHRSSQYVFLANIHPQLQLEVLAQIRGADFIACDTMHLWISTDRPGLEKLFRGVHAVFISEEEAVEFSGEESLPAAARAILSYGPRALIIKRGDCGSLLFTRDRVYSAPAIIVEQVRDPTGAGDAFAGGLMGALARAGQTDERSLREAMLYGNALGSLAVEDFSVRRIVESGLDDVEHRVGTLRDMMSLDDARPSGRP